MKKVIFFFFCIIVFLFHNPVFAHVLVTDGTIGAVLHIDPDDDPVIGQPSSFFFEFKDTTNKFRAADCDCKISVSLDGRELLSQELFDKSSSPGLTNSSFTYIFSQKGVYQISVTGQPQVPGEFQPFHLNYDIRVDRLSNNSQNTNNNGFAYRVGAILAIAVLFIVLIFSNRKKGGNKSGKKLAVVILLAGSVTVLHIIHSSQLLVQLEHHNHHSSQEHPCCIAQSADTPAKTFSSTPTRVREEHISLLSSAPNPPILSYRNTRSPPEEYS